MPRIPRNPGSGKAPHNGPARNEPATGSHGTAQPARYWTTEQYPSPDAKSAGKAVAAEIREKIAARKNEILDAQFARAIDPACSTGHAASVDLLNRIMPPEAKLDVRTDDLSRLSDADLAAEYARLTGAIRESGEGDVGAERPGQPGRLVN